MADSFISQAEIDALLKGNLEPASTDAAGLDPIEKDALGEIGNISMGSAATALSQLINRKVVITTPTTQVLTPRELFETFTVPYLAVEIRYTDGLKGVNLLIIKTNDAAIIADLMMGGAGIAAGEIGELQISAVAEAMNQMMGMASTSMSTIFQRAVSISPPTVTPVTAGEIMLSSPWALDEQVAVISFKMIIEDLIDSEIMQVVPVEVAKLQADLLLHPGGAAAAAAPVETELPPASELALPPLPELSPPPPLTMPEPPEPLATFPAGGVPAPALGAETRNLDLILDVPLDIAVVLGETYRPIRHILDLTPGAIVELDKAANEAVEVLVNGTLIARGEVVVVNENFGIRITDILDPYERVNKLRK